jgi:hypothetical protein
MVNAERWFGSMKIGGARTLRAFINGHFGSKADLVSILPPLKAG